MHIVIATPLYPPDIENPAPYVKELAGRLINNHEITIVTYGHLPEQVQGVNIITVRKNIPLLFRLFAYGKALRRVTKNADIIYAENGPSVELPISLVSLVTRVPLVVHVGDKLAHKHASSHFLLRVIERLSHRRAEKIITDIPSLKPEIFPLEQVRTTNQNAWNESWEKHVQMLEHTLTHAK